MKKVLFLFIISLCLLQMNGMAQKAQKAQVAISAGVSVSNIYGERGGLDTRGDARAGFTTGLVLNTPINKKGLYFQPGIHYVQKGMFTLKNESVREADALRYADVMLNVVKYFGSETKTRLYMGLGPQIGLNLPSKKVKIEDGDRSEIRSINFGNAAASDYRGIDFGANAIVGVHFKKGISLAVNYTFGLRNLIPEELQAGEDVLRNGALGFRLGYYIPNSPKEKKEKKKKD